MCGSGTRSHCFQSNKPHRGIYTRKFGDGQNTDPQSMDYPNRLPNWKTLKWTTLKRVLINVLSC